MFDDELAVLLRVHLRGILTSLFIIQLMADDMAVTTLRVHLPP